MLFLVVVVAAIVGLSKAPRTEAALVFDDEFEQGGLLGDWSWSGGVSSIYTVSGGLFNMVVTPNNDQWAGIDRGARILKAQRGTTWTIETRRNASTGNVASFGGLVVFKDAHNWISFGWLQESSLELSGIINDAFTGPLGVSTWADYLRLRRSGNSYYADASRDGRFWFNVNSYTDNAGVLNGARIGFLGKNWGSVGAYSISLDYFREQDQDVAPAELTRIQSTRRVSQITGIESSNRTNAFNVCGADYGTMFTWQYYTFIAFGDTRSCRPAADERPVTLAYSSDTQPSDGLRLDAWVTDARGEAKTLFVSDNRALTAYPTAGIGIGDTAYLFYTNVASWDWPPGHWTCSRSSVAYARAWDLGAWSKAIDTISWGPGNFNQLAVIRDPAPGSTTLFFLGTPCGRFGSVKLMMVDEASILDKRAYRYFAGLDADGLPTWSAEESRAVTVAGGPAGELSAVFDPQAQRYVMTYLDPAKEGIVLRWAASPWGPWSPPLVLARNADYDQLYGGFITANFIRDGGKTIYYTMSLFGPYNTYWMETKLP